MIELKTKLFEFNEDYDLLIIENYPEGYHYVLLKQKLNQVVNVCNDCRFSNDKAEETKMTGLHRGYPINLNNLAGFNVSYLAQKLFLNKAETYYIGKILRNHYDVPFKEFDE